MNELGMMQLTPRPGTRIRPEKSVKLVHCRIEALQKHGIARGAWIGPKRCVGIFHEVNHGTDIRSRDQSARAPLGSLLATATLPRCLHTHTSNKAAAALSAVSR